MLRRAGICAVLILLVFFSRALSRSAFAQGAPERADTAGFRLRVVWAKARSRYPDALLVSISGRTDASGAALCDPGAPFQDGWRFAFYSPKKDQLLLMAECGGAIAGPLSQLMDGGEPHESIQGRFEDSDVALRALEKSGISLDPESHKGGGKRPFSLRLARLNDARFPKHPVLWSVKIGEDSFFIDANSGQRFPPAGYDLTMSTASSATGRPAKDFYTAKKDLAGVMEFARREYPGARLMAIEGTVDAWGAASCSDIKDGWSYYFYYPKKKEYEAVFACKGSVAPGPTQYAPVDMDLQQPIEGDFADSDVILDAAARRWPELSSARGGGTVQGNLLLLNYRSSPFSQQGSWRTTLVWQLKLGEDLLKFDAVKARLLDVSE